MARQAPQSTRLRRFRGTPIGALTILAGCLCAVCWLFGRSPADTPVDWLGPLPETPKTHQGHGVLGGQIEDAAPDEAPQVGAVGRRQVWQSSAAAAAVAAAATWVENPEAADAFRNDRILNAKSQNVPGIRTLYQKLEGLRDDLYLIVETEGGVASSREAWEARPCDWFDGIDNKFDGELVLAVDPSGFGCEEFTEKIEGKIAVVPRGKCTFSKKVENAKKAGAKSVVVYDEKMSRMPLETQDLSGAVRSKGIAVRQAGDALTGGTYLLPVEKGMTIMAPEDSAAKPELDAAMVSLTNGTNLVQLIKAGKAPRVMDVTRSDFSSGVDKFLKKDLKILLKEMENYSNAQRVSKDDMNDPILKVLKKDRDDLAKGTKDKNYAEIVRAFKSWNSHLDKLGKWDLAETY